jgi:predicted nucleotidyltransferase component of viral defense system
MKDYLAELVRTNLTPAHSRNVTHEYLQARILGALQRAGAMIPLAFHGGTSLRFLYASARYSEDLDFALEKEKSRYDFRAYLQAIKSEMAVEGYAIEMKANDKKTVNSAFVRFPGLLYELGLSPYRNQVLSVKIEVDTNPPAGAVLTTSIVRRHLTLQRQHHDRASLLAGKLHAVLQRSHLRGRDLYDLLWYLSDPNWPAPNLTLLNNALQQTGWKGKPLAENNWRIEVRKRVEALEWQSVMNDVRPFLEPIADSNLLTHENLLRVLG